MARFLSLLEYKVNSFSLHSSYLLTDQRDLIQSERSLYNWTGESNGHTYIGCVCELVIKLVSFCRSISLDGLDR